MGNETFYWDGLTGRVAVIRNVFMVQVVSVGPVRLIPIVQAGRSRVVVAVHVFSGQIVSVNTVNTVRLIPIVLAGRVAVAPNANIAPIALGIRVPPTLIAEVGKPVVTENANTRTMIVLILPPLSLLVQ